MLDNFITDEEQSWSDKDVSSSTNYENTADRLCEKYGKFKKNKNYKQIAANNNKTFGEV